MQFQSKACCTKPPVTLSGGYDYKLKGNYVEIEGLKTCKLTLISLYRPIQIVIYES
jgi:hypothetical protein